MTFNANSLAALRHEQTSHSQEDWLRALQSARQSSKPKDVENRDLKEIALASASPALFTTKCNYWRRRIARWATR